MTSCAQQLNPDLIVLQDILSPMSHDEFINRYFGRSFCHIQGPEGKFSNLLPWNALNRILEEHRLGPPRLRLFQSGKPIPKDKYLFPPDKHGTSLRAPELTNLLAQGATLIVDAFDELYPPVRELAEALEHVFRIYVQVNMYAGWRTDQGFLLHYDEHDTVILQIAGRKHWQVYRPTRLYPLEEGKDAQPAKKPDEGPIWDNIMNDGDLLYMPRGWWHVAYPLDEPTLHLTVGLRNHRGLDFLIWVANQLSDCLEVRQDIPILADRDAQATYMTTLKKHLFTEWSDDLLDRFLASRDTSAMPRRRFLLPQAATPLGIAICRQSQVRLTGPRRLDLSGSLAAGSLNFKCSDKTFHCSAQFLPALEKLNDGNHHSIDELMALVGDREANLLNFLQGLALQGILITVN
jgi:hypothetical protein